MSKFYMTVFVTFVLLTGCTSKSDEVTYPKGKIGEWSVYISDSNAIQIGIWDLNIYQDKDTIVADLCNENFEGVIVGDTLVFTNSDTTSLNPVTYKGRIIGKNISGTYTFQNGGGGTWTGTSEYMHQNLSRYYVFGGNIPVKFIEEVGMHPERFGFKVMGSGKSTGTFTGDFPYYIIVTYPDNTAKIDAVGCDGGHYFETYFSAHAYNHENIGTPPDGKYAILGKAGFPGEEGPGGFVGIDASSVQHSSVTIYIPE